MSGYGLLVLWRWVLQLINVCLLFAFLILNSPLEIVFCRFFVSYLWHSVKANRTHNTSHGSQNVGHLRCFKLQKCCLVMLL